MSEGLAGLLSVLQPAVVLPLDLEAIRREGWEAGFAAGAAEADAGLAPWRDRLAAAAAGLEAACVVDVDRLRPVMLGLVRGVAETVLGYELSSKDKVLSALVDCSLEALKPGSAALLRAHPATLAGLGAVAVATEGDPGMGLDEVVVSGADFVIEAGLSARLAEIMGKMA